MRKIIGIIHPFDKYQTFYVYEDGNKLEMKQITIEKALETVFQLAKKYQAYQIDLTGSKFFLQKFVTQIKQKEIIEYSKQKFIIRII